MNKIEKAASDIRRFNRFYLPFFRLLTQKYLNSDYSMAEARILYEMIVHSFQQQTKSGSSYLRIHYFLYEYSVHNRTETAAH